MRRRDFLKGAAALALAPKLLANLPAAADDVVLNPVACWPTGTFICQDGGTLELGLVRDTMQAVQNDFALFGESFIVNGERVSPIYVTTA